MSTLKAYSELKTEQVISAAKGVQAGLVARGYQVKWGVLTTSTACYQICLTVTSPDGHEVTVDVFHKYDSRPAMQILGCKGHPYWSMGDKGVSLMVERVVERLDRLKSMEEAAALCKVKDEEIKDKTRADLVESGLSLDRDYGLRFYRRPDGTYDIWEMRRRTVTKNQLCRLLKVLEEP